MTLYGCILRKAELMFRGEALVEAKEGKKNNESHTFQITRNKYIILKSKLRCFFIKRYAEADMLVLKLIGK